MEADLNCNVKQCGAQLSNQAVVTACSHALCLDCASRHDFTGSGPYTCPVCRQTLIGGEIYKQVLQPSDEWKSVALCGLNPIVIMECAGRAVSFWSYQMTNQIMFQLQKNKDLQQQCLNLEGEVENMWNQGNARISSLTAKMKDMELREQGLIRKCEDLRLNLAGKASELCRSQELYNKLKHRVLLEQSPGSVGDRPSKPAPAVPSPNFGNKRTHPLAYVHQAKAPAMGVPNTQVTDYFPESPSFSKIQANQVNLGVVGWNDPAHADRTKTPFNQAHVVNSGPSGLMSTARTAPGPIGSVSVSGRFHSQQNSRQNQPGEASRRFGGAGMSDDRGATRIPGDEGGFASAGGRIRSFQPPISHYNEATQRAGARAFDPLSNVIRR